jgi:hypothetical protein
MFFIKNLTISHMLKKELSALHETQRFISYLQKPAIGPYPKLCESILLLSSHLSLGLPIVSFLQVLLSKLLMYFCFMSCVLDGPHKIEDYYKLSSTPLLSCYFISRGWQSSWNFIVGGGKEILLSYTASRPALGPLSPPIRWMLGGPLPWSRTAWNTHLNLESGLRMAETYLHSPISLRGINIICKGWAC